MESYWDLKEGRVGSCGGRGDRAGRRHSGLRGRVDVRECGHLLQLGEKMGLERCLGGA